LVWEGLQKKKRVKKSWGGGHLIRAANKFGRGKKAKTKRNLKNFLKKRVYDQSVITNGHPKVTQTHARKLKIQGQEKRWEPKTGGARGK